MNYKVVFSILGKAILIEAFLLIIPLFVGVIYNENNYLCFLIPMILLFIIGIPLTLLKCPDNSLYAKEGFVIVSFSWIVFSLFGALPFVISGDIPNYIDALFETISGFTTTGASILDNNGLEQMSNAVMFWRMFTHWIGGMGILVFVLAIMPTNNVGVMRVFKAESPGPSASKLVTKLRFTARILYSIYIILTLIEVVLLWAGGLSLFDSFLMAFTTAGTGGFGILGDSAVSYSSFVQVVIAIFMMLFSINFNFYYLLLIGSVSKAFAMEEVRAFLILTFTSTIIISINLFLSLKNIYTTYFDALKHSFFQVMTISSTTGLFSTNVDLWPALSMGILYFLMFIGACGGSSGGGLKVSRMIILGKSCTADFKKLLHPRSVVSSKFEGEIVSAETERNVRTYFIVWLIIVIISTLLLSLERKFNLLTNFTATLACINNIGLCVNVVGPPCNYLAYSYFSKIVLSLTMLLGRLEIFPILILFSRRTWKKY